MRSKTSQINRFSQILRFLRVSRLLLWTIWVIYRERRRVIRARERGNYEVQPNIEVLVQVLVAFRQTAIKLGVLMIKLGQFLSSRADLLPEQALAALSSLQDEVPPAPFNHVVSVIETDLGKPVEQLFSTLERKCTAAASLGQVHKAVLASNGATVAVKVQRPNIEQLVRMDLSTLKFVIWVINRFVNTGDFIDLMGFYQEFKRTVYEEIDYVTEATNAKRFKEMFKDDPTIYIPDIYEDYTSPHVLVLEWIDGIKINDYPALEAAHIDRLEIAKRTVSTYFYQFFIAGFFHADPHPGNIFVLTEEKARTQRAAILSAKQQGNATSKTMTADPSSGPVIAFVDFGMVGSLSKTMKKSMKDLFLSFITRDSHQLVNALKKLGFIGEGANVAAIERGMSLMMENYYGMTLGEARDLDMPEVAHDVENLLYGQPFQIPAQFAFTGRAISTLVGVSTGLAPEFNFVEVATPYARKFLGLDAEGIGQTVQQVLSQVLEAGRTLLALPRELEQVITRLEAGQVEVRLAGISPSGNGKGRHGRNRRNGLAAAAATGSGNLALGLVFLGTLAGGIVLTMAHQVVPGWFCLGLAGVTVLGLLFKR
ncbi:MAG TPA: AarF/ABC1/UbiB kinase family protein [Ktedonobacteraceae bacterium]|nr:AarF/ABC1/UbiB kinase family protein [Ktedonobacteraceae bacterium]